MLLNHCLLLTQHDKQLVKTVEKLFFLHAVDFICQTTLYSKNWRAEFSLFQCLLLTYQEKFASGFQLIYFFMI